MPDVNEVILLEQSIAKMQMSDGCKILMTGNGGKAEQWSVLFPAGFVIVCPHGFIASFMKPTTVRTGRSAPQEPPSKEQPDA